MPQVTAPQENNSTPATEKKREKSHHSRDRKEKREKKEKKSSSHHHHHHHRKEKERVEDTTATTAEPAKKSHHSSDHKEKREKKGKTDRKETREKKEKHGHRHHKHSKSSSLTAKNTPPSVVASESVPVTTASKPVTSVSEYTKEQAPEKNIFNVDFSLLEPIEVLESTRTPTSPAAASKQALLSTGKNLLSEGKPRLSTFFSQAIADSGNADGIDLQNYTRFRNKATSPQSEQVNILLKELFTSPHVPIIRKILALRISDLRSAAPGFENLLEEGASDALFKKTAPLEEKLKVLNAKDKNGETLLHSIARCPWLDEKTAPSEQDVRKAMSLMNWLAMEGANTILCDDANASYPLQTLLARCAPIPATISRRELEDFSASMIANGHVSAVFRLGNSATVSARTDSNYLPLDQIITYVDENPVTLENAHFGLFLHRLRQHALTLKNLRLETEDQIISARGNSIEQRKEYIEKKLSGCFHYCFSNSYLDPDTLEHKPHANDRIITAAVSPTVLEIFRNSLNAIVERQAIGNEKALYEKMQADISRTISIMNEVAPITKEKFNNALRKEKAAQGRKDKPIDETLLKYTKQRLHLLATSYTAANLKEIKLLLDGTEGSAVRSLLAYAPRQEKTPLHLICESITEPRHVSPAFDAIRYIIALKKCDDSILNIPDNDKKTPLHTLLERVLAVGVLPEDREKLKDVIRACVEKGAEITKFFAPHPDAVQISEGNKRILEQNRLLDALRDEINKVPTVKDKEGKKVVASQVALALIKKVQNLTGVSRSLKAITLTGGYYYDVFVRNTLLLLPEKQSLTPETQNISAELSARVDRELLGGEKFLAPLHRRMEALEIAINNPEPTIKKLALFRGDDDDLLAAERGLYLLKFIKKIFPELAEHPQKEAACSAINAALGNSGETILTTRHINLQALLIKELMDAIGKPYPADVAPLDNFLHSIKISRELIIKKMSDAISEKYSGHKDPFGAFLEALKASAATLPENHPLRTYRREEDHQLETYLTRYRSLLRPFYDAACTENVVIADIKTVQQDLDTAQACVQALRKENTVSNNLELAPRSDITILYARPVEKQAGLIDQLLTGSGKTKEEIEQDTKQCRERTITAYLKEFSEFLEAKRELGEKNDTKEEQIRQFITRKQAKLIEACASPLEAQKAAIRESAEHLADIQETKEMTNFVRRIYENLMKRQEKYSLIQKGLEHMGRAIAPARQEEAIAPARQEQRPAAAPLLALNARKQGSHISPELRSLLRQSTSLNMHGKHVAPKPPEAKNPSPDNEEAVIERYMDFLDKTDPRLPSPQPKKPNLPAAENVASSRSETPTNSPSRKLAGILMQRREEHHKATARLSSPQQEVQLPIVVVEAAADAQPAMVYHRSTSREEKRKALGLPVVPSRQEPLPALPALEKKALKPKALFSAHQPSNVSRLIEKCSKYSRRLADEKTVGQGITLKMITNEFEALKGDIRPDELRAFLELMEQLRTVSYSKESDQQTALRFIQILKPKCAPSDAEKCDTAIKAIQPKIAAETHPSPDVRPSHASRVVAKGNYIGGK